MLATFVDFSALLHQPPCHLVIPNEPASALVLVKLRTA